MNERHARYLLDLRARHAAELKALDRALTGRRSGVLRALRKYHAAIERETSKIFTAIDHREGSHEGSKERT
jgi:hypothetical protein